MRLCTTTVPTAISRPRLWMAAMRKLFNDPARRMLHDYRHLVGIRDLLAENRHLGDGRLVCGACVPDLRQHVADYGWHQTGAGVLGDQPSDRKSTRLNSSHQ